MEDDRVQVDFRNQRVTLVKRETLTSSATAAIQLTNEQAVTVAKAILTKLERSALA